MESAAERAALGGFRRLAGATAAATFALILLGGVVRVSDSGLGCGPAGSGTHGWPLCGGRLIPFVETGAIVEYSHRLLAAAVGAMVLVLAWRALRRLPRHRRLVRGSLAAVGLVLLQGALGGLTVEKNLHELLVATHLLAAMVMLALLMTLRRAADPGGGDVSAETSAEGRAGGLRPLTLAAGALVLATIASGGYMAGTQRYGTADYQLGGGAHLACGKDFPACNGEAMPFGQARLVDIHLTHRLFMYLAVAAILALILLARRRGVLGRPLRLAGAILLAQVAVGALNVWLGEHELLIVAHLALATLLWASLVAAALRLAPLPAPARAPGGGRPAGALAGAGEGAG